ncbi:MAG: tetratricopeptide repeat protein [Candidatus Puniceispirillaceae bacterium]
MAKLCVDQALLKAKSYVKKGKIEEAQKLYQMVLQACLESKRAQQGLAAAGLPSQAINVQAPPQEIINQLVNLYNQGQLAAVIEQATSLTEQYPEAFIVWNVLGAAKRGLGHLADASEAFRKVTKLNPDFADGFNNLGITLRGQGKLDEAIASYNKALSLKPDYTSAYFNMGNTLKDQSKLDEAIEAYTKAIAIKPDYAEAHNNMGITLQERGQLDEAIEACTKAIAIKPDYAEAYNNMGIALRDLGRFDEAIEAYTKAITLKSDYADAYSNMGNTLKDQGKLDEAIESYIKALSLKPDYAEAYNNMGIALQDQGKLDEAIASYNKALSLKPDYVEAYYNMGIALKGITFEQPNPSLQNTIFSLLDKKSYVRPMNIAPAAISLLKFEPELLRHLKNPSFAEAEPEILEVIADLCKLPLLLKLMSICPIADIVLEHLFKSLRASLLLSISDLTGSPEMSNFQSALALQCFTNEYVYNQNQNEDEALAALEDAVKNALSIGNQPNSHFILCLASYKPLNHYDWSGLLRITDEIQDVFTRQVTEPNQEASLKTVLPALEEITDEVSFKVKEQYEAHPYPRWVNLGLPLQPATIFKVVNELKLNLFDQKIKEVESPNILIAGCGTGQHSIGTAVRFTGSKVLAIDLSMSSLSYARRKTEEFGIQNIDYMQADILGLGKLDRQFDIVQSSGVLHHMDDPLAGWRVLTDCLKPGGLMKIGLYSELGRQHIAEIRQEISKAGIGSSDEEMKSFRTEVINSDQGHHQKILNSHDFYSLSTLRDLLFHIQEHRFTIPQIQDCLSELGLKFCGFEAEKTVSQFRLTNAEGDDLYDLDKWQDYERANPSAFIGMYQFWCQKTV